MVASSTSVEHTSDDLGAAPPDSAGHQGSFTRPEDTMQRIDRDAAEHPATDRDAVAPKGRGGAALTWLAAVLFLLVVVFFVLYAVGRL